MTDKRKGKQMSRTTNRRKQKDIVKTEPFCFMCERPRKEVGALLEANSKFICDDCATACYKCIEDQRQAFALEKILNENVPSPEVILAHLNEYVIGQARAKKVVSVATYNHYQRLTNAILATEQQTDIEIDKSNVLLVGPTGCGKTFIPRMLAKKLNVPFAIGDATTLTEAGYVGEDVENLLLKLITAANGDIAAAQKGIIYIDEIDKTRKTGGNVSITRDVSGEGVQQSLLKILEGTVASVPPQGGRKHPEQQCLQVDTTNILFICGGAFVGIEHIIEKRLGRGEMGFGAVRHHSEDSRRKKYNELIHRTTSSDLIEFGMIPEFVGRVPVIVPMEELDEAALMSIITKPRNCILKQYQRLAFLSNQSKLEFTDGAIRAIVKKAQEQETGARALRSVFEGFMVDIMFSLPSKERGKTYVVTEEVVEGTKSLFDEVNEAA